jgi:hypothetical protein
LLAAHSEDDVCFWLQGVLKVSPVTGQLEPTYPAWKRNMFRYLISVPVIFLCLLLVFIVMIVTLQLQVRISVTGRECEQWAYPLGGVIQSIHHSRNWICIHCQLDGGSLDHWAVP